MATYPSTLPAPLAGAYSLNPVDQTVRTDMEMGAPRVRRRTAARNDRVAVGWLFTVAELDTFRDWFESASTGIAGGASWFSVALDVGTGTTLASVEARFVGPFQAARDGNKWRVTATLEVR